MTTRSGSETRQRDRIYTVRFTQKEAAIVRRKAIEHGQSVAALVRSSLLHIRLQPSRIDRQEVARLLAELGKIGSNVNQIAYHLNAGRPPERVRDSIELAMRDLAELRIACLQAIGMEPRRGDKGEG